MDPKHNPEFTTIELYQAFTDFHGMMDRTRTPDPVRDRHVF